MHKKQNFFLITLLVILLLMMGLPKIIFGAAATPVIYVDGKQVKATTILTKIDRTLISVREYYEALGGTVHWDVKDNSVSIHKDNNRIHFIIGSTKANVNGKSVKLDQASYEVNGKTFVPVRFVAEALGAQVKWIQKENTAYITTKKAPISEYDVVVIGTDPEGIIAAIAAAREGQQTLLIDSRSRLGGLFTLGELNTLDMNYSPQSILLTQGLFQEFFELIERRSSFDTLQAEKVFQQMIAKESKLTLITSAKDIKPVKEGNHITAIQYKDSKGVQQNKKGKQFIDSTQNGDFAYDAGVHFTYGQQDYRGADYAMSVTLVFEISGLDWTNIRKVIREDGNSGTGSDNYSAWGFPEMHDYPAKQENVKIRALNIGRLDNGNYLVNALQILDINGLNEDELTKARKAAEKELPDIISFMKQNLKGFEKVKLVRTADEIYIRETRHMVGHYQLSVNDVLENRDFPDKIAFGSYPIDVQATVESPDLIIGNPSQFSIPFRSIVPKEINNLLVASKSSSYESLAHGSARVVPVGMVVGEAAGVASAYANKKGKDFISMATDSSFTDAKAIQAILNSKGANLVPIPAYENPIMQHWSYEGVKLLRKFAIISGGYKNNYDLDITITNQAFNSILYDANERSSTNKTFTYIVIEESNPLTKEMLLAFLADNGFTITDLSPQTRIELNKKDIITNDVAYMVIYEIIKK